MSHPYIIPLGRGMPRQLTTHRLQAVITPPQIILRHNITALRMHRPAIIRLQPVRRTLVPHTTRHIQHLGHTRRPHITLRHQVLAIPAPATSRLQVRLPVPHTLHHLQVRSIPHLTIRLVYHQLTLHLVIQVQQAAHTLHHLVLTHTQRLLQVRMAPPPLHPHIHTPRHPVLTLILRRRPVPTVLPPLQPHTQLHRLMRLQLTLTPPLRMDRLMAHPSLIPHHMARQSRIPHHQNIQRRAAAYRVPAVIPSSISS